MSNRCASSRHIDNPLMFEDVATANVVFALFDRLLLDQIDPSADDRAQLFFHLAPPAHPRPPVGSLGKGQKVARAEGPALAPTTSALCLLTSDLPYVSDATSAAKSGPCGFSIPSPSL